jgi:large subunit ribosomal protein L3
MSGLLGKKLRMTQIFTDKGEVVPVTMINAGPCYVTQVKSKDTDGYDAVQVGYSEMKEKHANKPEAGHCKKAGVATMRHLKEFKMAAGEELKAGDELRVSMFNVGDLVTLTSTSKGRGFQGAMKRHGFSGANKTHGQSDRWRAPGSLGQSSYPSRVFKGLRMAGRMGNDTVTIKTYVVRVDEESNLLFVKGAIPGSENTIVQIKK